MSFSPRFKIACHANASILHQYDEQAFNMKKNSKYAHHKIMSEESNMMTWPLGWFCFCRRSQNGQAWHETWHIPSWFPKMRNFRGNYAPIRFHCWDESMRESKALLLHLGIVNLCCPFHTTLCFLHISSICGTPTTSKLSFPVSQRLAAKASCSNC